jgi:hypothetical protein
MKQGMGLSYAMGFVACKQCHGLSSVKPFFGAETFFVRSSRPSVSDLADEVRTLFQSSRRQQTRQFAMTTV